MKKFGIAVIFVALLVLTAVVFVGCSSNGTDSVADKTVEQIKDTVSDVTAVQIEDTTVYMSSYGDPSTYTLKPWVVPSNASNKNVNYKILNKEDREYISVDRTTGTITASKLKETEGDIVIRISSESNPGIYVDVKVIIENVAVQKISFSGELSMQLDDVSAQIVPTFKPAHAVLGRNVTYKSLNTSVATVDSLGVVRPVGVGNVTVWVTASNDENKDESELVTGNLQVSVSYSEPNYQLSIGNTALACKQISTSPTPIVLALDKLDNTCDPNPTIRWRIANANIPYTEDYKTINYLPKDLPRGDYQIQVTITDASSQVQVLYSDTISVYEPLETIDIALSNSAEELENLMVNDIVQAVVSCSQDQYPPDNYRWKIYRNGVLYAVETVNTKSFEYKILTSGSYSFECEAIVQGVASGVVRATGSYESQGGVEGCEIYGAYVTAAEYSADNYLGYISWGSLLYDADFIVQITKNDGVVTTMSSTDSAYSSYFRACGCFLPTSVVSLEESFTYEIRTSSYGWSEEFTYEGGSVSVTNANKLYYRKLIDGLDFDCYIDSMEEWGALLNYVSVFRPSALLDDQDRYTFTVKVPFGYSSLSTEEYPLPENCPTVREDYQDVMNTVYAAFNCYGDTIQYTSAAYYDATIKALTLYLTFSENTSALVQTAPTANDVANVYTPTHYKTASASTSNARPIDSLEKTISVANSMELYYAVAMGYKPVCVAGSSAETVYTEARAVIKRIISDNMTDVQKVHAIYDFLTTETIYDRWLAGQTSPSSRYESFYPEGVFLRKLAVCDGIAKSFVLLCGIEGITAQKVSGTAGGTGHAWNKVLVDGKWYVCDCTWGSTQSGNKEFQNHRYLLTTDAAIAADHVTYGKYERSETSQNGIYFEANLAGSTTVDAFVESATELSALLTYVHATLSSTVTIVSVDFLLSEAYYEDMLATGVYLSITGVIRDTFNGISCLLSASDATRYVTLTFQS